MLMTLLESLSCIERESRHRIASHRILVLLPLHPSGHIYCSFPASQRLTICRASFGLSVGTMWPAPSMVRSIEGQEQSVGSDGLQGGSLEPKG